MKSLPTTMSSLLVCVLTALLCSNAFSSTPSEAEQITKALELYSQATPMDVNKPERTELLKRAETLLTGVIDNNPDSLDAHRKLMGVYLQLRDYRSAVKTMQDAISLSPEDPKLFIALAILYDHQGAYEYAVPVLDQALLLDPDQQLAKDYKASIQQKIDRQKIAMQASPAPHQLAPHQLPDQTADQLQALHSR